MCRPATLLDGIDNASALAIDGSGVYFLLADKILACPLEGCGALAPRQIGSNLPTSAMSGLAAVNNHVVFAANGGYLSCPESGCAATLPFIDSVGYTFEILAGTAQEVFYAQAAEQGYFAVKRCVLPTSTCASINQVISAHFGALGKPFAVDGNSLFVSLRSPAISRLAACPVDGTGIATTIDASCTTLTTKQESNDWGLPSLLTAGGGYVEAVSGTSFYSCPQSGCAQAKLLTRVANNVLEITSDASGVYWLQGDAASATVATCPHADCSGGARTLASLEATAHSIRVYGNFVYWVSGGRRTLDGTSTEPGTGMIRRVAK